MRPHANAHYLMTPPGLIRVAELPYRWGLLVMDGRRVRVVRRSAWQEVADTRGIEGAIARALTGQRMRVLTKRPTADDSMNKGYRTESPVAS